MDLFHSGNQSPIIYIYIYMFYVNKSKYGMLQDTSLNLRCYFSEAKCRQILIYFSVDKVILLSIQKSTKRGCISNDTKYTTTSTISRDHVNLFH